MLKSPANFKVRLCIYIYIYTYVYIDSHQITKKNILLFLMHELIANFKKIVFDFFNIDCKAFRHFSITRVKKEVFAF